MIDPRTGRRRVLVVDTDGDNLPPTADLEEVLFTLQHWEAEEAAPDQEPMNLPEPVAAVLASRAPGEDLELTAGQAAGIAVDLHGDCEGHRRRRPGCVRGRGVRVRSRREGMSSPKALSAWTELNDRQQGTLSVIYALDQENEEAHRQAGARGEYDSRPAAEWRAIDFAHDPSNRKVFGWTEMQMRLSRAGWDNQGNGSTMAALTDRGLIAQSGKPTAFGVMRRVALTRAGRAAARAGLSLRPGAAPKAALGRRAWEVLALLWSADLAGTRLEWGRSGTIERVLIGKHVPPLAARVGVGYGYEITQRGREFYREHYGAHAAAHPDVHAPHPDGESAEPWPKRADEILAEHQRYYAALREAWRNAHTAQQQAEQETAVAVPAIADVLPAPVAEQITARHALWQDTARQRAELAAAHVTDLHQRAGRAARAYAVAALAAFGAAVAGADPLDGLNDPGHDDGGWDEPPLAPPAETGIHAIDAESAKLHAVAVGAPVKRRGPAPTAPTAPTAPAPPRAAAATPPPLPNPGADLAALARFLHGHAQGGVLLRRLHSGTVADLAPSSVDN